MALPKIFYITTEDSGTNVVGIETLHGISLDVRLLCAQSQYAKRFKVWPPLFDQLVAKTGAWPSQSLEYRGVEHDLMREILTDDLITILSIDRHNWTGASAMAMMRLVWRYLEVWDALLKEHRPDCVIFHDSPHWGSAHVLYQCCISRGIPTLCVLNTLFRNRLIVRRTVTGPNERHRDWSCRPEDLIPSEYVASGIDKQKWSPAIRSTFKVDRRFRRLLTLEGIRTAISYHPQEFPDIVPEKRVGRVKRFMFNLNTTRSIKEVAELLEDYSIDSLPEDPYVYFPFHLQPEATTVPLGGCYWDQANVARLLANCLPEGWMLAIKEHPQMFRYSRGWPRARSLSFYRDLIGQPKVIVLGMKVKSKEAIQNAHVVATITGTVGWEALNIGKPVLAFGYPWYQSFPGVTLVQELEDPRAFLTAYFSRLRSETTDQPSLQNALANACREGEFMPGPWRDHTLDDNESREQLSDEYGRSIASYVQSCVA